MPTSRRLLFLMRFARHDERDILAYATPLFSFTLIIICLPLYDCLILPIISLHYAAARRLFSLLITLSPALSPRCRFALSITPFHVITLRHFRDYAVFMITARLRIDIIAAMLHFLRRWRHAASVTFMFAFRATLACLLPSLFLMPCCSATARAEMIAPYAAADR